MGFAERALTHTVTQPECLGRALCKDDQGWNAGADGVYTFNMFKTRDRIYRELGDPEALQKLDKVYRLNPVGYSMAQQHFNADPFLRVPVLSPRHPSPLKAGQPTEIRLPV